MSAFPGDASAAAAAKARGPAAGRPPAAPYLEDSGNTVTRHFEAAGNVFKVKSCGCRSRFCERCCKPLGYALREKLIEVLRTFHTVFMITMTVDPELFENNGELAYIYLRDKRCVALLVQTLFRAGYLRSRRYFYVVEWQEKTEFPHFHLVLDAEFIPFNAICGAWNQFRPDGCGPVQGRRPGFGSVQFTRKWSGAAERAGRYVSKYLTKYPKGGYPDWVLDADYRVRRFSSSRGFWGESPPRDAEEWAGREDLGAMEAEEGEWPIEREDVVTIRERVAGCGTMSAVFETVFVADISTGEVVEERDEFLGHIAHPLSWVAERLTKFESPHPFVLVVSAPLSRLQLGELMAPALGVPTIGRRSATAFLQGVQHG